MDTAPRVPWATAWTFSLQTRLRLGVAGRIVRGCLLSLPGTKLLARSSLRGTSKLICQTQMLPGPNTIEDHCIRKEDRRGSLSLPVSTAGREGHFIAVLKLSQVSVASSIIAHSSSVRTGRTAAAAAGRPRRLVYVDWGRPRRLCYRGADQSSVPRTRGVGDVQERP